MFFFSYHVKPEGVSKKMGKMMCFKRTNRNTRCTRGHYLTTVFQEFLLNLELLQKIQYWSGEVFVGWFHSEVPALGA